MNLILTIGLLGIVTFSGVAGASASVLTSKNIAAITLEKGAITERIVTLRTPKFSGRAHGYPALIWTECQLKSERTRILKMNKSGSVRHYGVYQALGARLELPADILAADADQRGVLNLATLTLYQGNLARLSWQEYEARFLAAISRLGALDDLSRPKVELVFNSSNIAANRRHAEIALEFLGGERGVRQLLRACGTPAGLRNDMIDFSLMNN